MGHGGAHSTSHVEKKGDGLKKLLELAEQLHARPFIKVGVLFSSASTRAEKPEPKARTKAKTGTDYEKEAWLQKWRGKGPRVPKAGKPQSGTSGRGTENITIAIIHEFGAPRAGIPSRSFLRSTAREKREEWLKLLERVLVLVLKEKLELEEALKLVGERAAADVRRKITSGPGIPPPLKEATIRAKGSSRPLVDTGQLVRSISYEIHTGRE